MVSKARDDLPDPDSPVMTIRLLRGRSRSTFLRLCSRAPRMVMDFSSVMSPPICRGVSGTFCKTRMDRSIACRSRRVEFAVETSDPHFAKYLAPVQHWRSNMVPGQTRSIHKHLGGNVETPDRLMPVRKPNLLTETDTSNRTNKEQKRLVDCHHPTDGQRGDPVR
jgi:hypothetical protein